MSTKQPVQGSQVVLRRQVQAALYGQYGDCQEIETFLVVEVLASESGISCILTSEYNPLHSVKVDYSEIELVPDNWFD